jgi:hypothetical protein
MSIKNGKIKFNPTVSHIAQLLCSRFCGLHGARYGVRVHEVRVPGCEFRGAGRAKLTLPGEPKNK